MTDNDQPLTARAADGFRGQISRRVDLALSWILIVGFIGNFTSIEQDLYRPVDMAFSVYYAIWSMGMFVLLRMKKTGQAFKLFCWGYWSYACLKALTVAGIHSPIIGSIAPLIMVTAWVHGKRAAIVMLALSIAFYLILTYLETHGLLYAFLVRSASDLLVFYALTAIAFLGIGLMIVDNVNILMSTSTKLSTELSRKVDELQASQIELSRLNEELESRVALRTTELEQANQSLTTTLHQLTMTQRQMMDQEKMASLGSMVAGISHELNTPIGNALIVSGVLESKALDFSVQVQGGKLTKSIMGSFLKDVGEASEVLQKSLLRASDLIQSFKRVAVDQTSEYRRTFSLKRVVEDNLQAFYIQLKAAGIAVEVAIPEDISCDSFPGALGQIITNLVQNAIVHAFQNPNNAKLVFTGSAAGNIVTLTVQDNGAGMPPHVLSRIFDPFYTTRFGQGGSGIGLSISRRIATSTLDGDLTARSTTGQGSTFTLTFARVATGKI